MYLHFTLKKMLWKFCVLPSYSGFNVLWYGKAGIGSEIQSSAVITRSYLLPYYIPHFDKWQKKNEILKPQQTPHISPSRASYGVSIVRIWEKIDRVITATYCMCVILYLLVRLLWATNTYIFVITMYLCGMAGLYVCTNYLLWMNALVRSLTLSRGSRQWSFLKKMKVVYDMYWIFMRQFK